MATKDTQLSVPRPLATRRETEAVSRSAELSSASPTEAMRDEEVARFLAMNRAMRWLCVGILATLPFLGGDPLLKALLAIGMALGVPLGLLFDRMVVRPGWLTPQRISGVAFGVTVNAYIGVLYFGVFSAAAAIVVMGLFQFSRTENPTSALLAYLTTAVAQAVLSGLMMAHVIADPGLIRLVGDELQEQITLQALIQIMFLFSYLVGVASRKSTLEAMDKLESARRQVSERDALLQEARHDIEALNVGAPGRYSDQTIGSYHLGNVVGRGAMAEVYEASHVDSGERAAIKLLHSALLAQPKAVARFLREARAAAALDSPHVARIQEASDPLDPLPYIAMEYLSGHDLGHLLRDQHRLSFEEVIELVSQVGSVISAASAQGIVHRDLKPQNLFLVDGSDADPLWKVLDFGVSALSEGSGTLTQGHVVGTPAYMSPEQARGADVDHRTDLHALAAVAYRCLTGRPPFHGRDIPAVMYAATHTMPVRPSELVPSLPADVDAALAVGLAKRREQRYDSATELVVALRQARDGALDDAVHERAAAVLAELDWGQTGNVFG